jgi:hypothetical protein
LDYVDYQVDNNHSFVDKMGKVVVRELAAQKRPFGNMWELEVLVALLLPRFVYGSF